MHARTRYVAALAVVAAAVAAAAAKPKDIHIPPGRTTNFTWYLNDGAGYRWDIAATGQVSDGTNDAYDGGMQLRISGSGFSSSSSQGRLSKDGREVEIGPWRHGSLQIWRRVYIDAKVGYCRWIDIFENTSTTAQNVPVQYYSNMGGTTRMTYTTTGKTEPTDKDWGIVTGYSTSSSSRPTIAHVFATKNAKIRPRFRYTRNSDSLYYDIALKIQPKKTVALCLFEAQRRPANSAKKFLADFKPKRELSKVPPGLRRIIVNMGGAMLVLGNIDLPRHEKHDLAVLRNENELLGKILNERFDVEAFYGKLELPADQVVGLNVPSPHDAQVQVVLVNGQVVAGRLLNAPVRIRLTNGNEMALPPKKLASATFALSSGKPEEIKLSRPTLTLRSGQRLAFHDEDLDCTYHTMHGTLELDTEDLRALHLDTPEGGLHRAAFRNGTILSGLLVPERLKLTLDLGPTLEVRRYLVHEFLFPGTAVNSAPLACVTLRNEDELYGRLTDEALTASTGHGKVVIKPAEIAELRVASAGTLGQVNFKLHNGTSVTGKLLTDRLHFQVEPGPKIDLFLGHVAQITCPKSTAAGAAPKPAPKPTPAPPAVTPVPPPPGTAVKRAAAAPVKPALTPAAAAAVAQETKKLLNELKELEARRKALQKLQAALAKRAAGNNTPADKARAERYAKADAEIASKVKAISAKLAKLRQTTGG